MSSRSSSDEGGPKLPLGRVAGHRGTGGELTVKVAAGDAAPWLELERVWIANQGDVGAEYVVERARGYRDRLVLKLRGIDGPGEAAELAGRYVSIPEDAVPRLPEGEVWVAGLVGLDVYDVDRGRLGVVRDFLPTGGVDLLIVQCEGDGEEVMIPMAREILVKIDQADRRITVRLPDGLLDVNRR